MNLSFTTIQIAMLALPGLIFATVDASNSHRLRQIGFQFWVKVFVSGVASYAILALAYRCFELPFHGFEIDEKPKTTFSEKADEIACSIPVALAISLGWIAAKTHQIFSKLLRLLRISDFSGCDDIWEYALRNASPVRKWVHFRDLEHELIYEGWVGAYSDGPDVRELLMNDVSVYDFNANKLYDQHAIYLSRPVGAINLEFCLENSDEQAA